MKKFVWGIGFGYVYNGQLTPFTIVVRVLLDNQFIIIIRPSTMIYLKYDHDEWIRSAHLKNL